MNWSSLFIHSILILFLLSSPVSARPEYASDTGQSCSTCHLDPGTGELNEMGKAYSITHQWPPGEVSSTKRIIISLAGFIHMLAAMILVGSMVFVHLIHTPGILALSGVPKKELEQGWTALYFIAISGIYLTINRFHDLDGLLNSNPGRLVLGKMILFSIMVTIAFLLSFVINKKLKNATHQQSLVEEIDNEMTFEELEKYDGSSNETFIAYAGVIFDVSNSRLWRGGTHMKRHKAGTDLTLEFREAPHGPQVLDNFQAVSRVKQEKAKLSTGIIVKIFKIAALTNFVCALLAVLLSAFIAWPL
ncbi:MAG: cytochrome b5 domain-containing protein [ANME-2 cluster archaeon]|nr:cytochrome b5 domain-containing protein [ANME-2 cluster archaeon]